jgi:hypothetical protein
MSEHAIISNQLEIPHSTMGEVELPCGLIRDGSLITKAFVREISGHEEDMLASDKIKPITKLTELISRCVIKLGDITDREFIAKAAREMTIGDRAWLILAIRRRTLGDIFPYTEVCPNPACKVKRLFQVNLGDLEMRKMADPMRRLYEVELPVCGKSARFHVMTGADEEEISKYQTDMISRALHVRVEMLGDRKPSLDEIKSLSMRDRDTLRAKIDEVEGGVDTEIEMTCVDCGMEFSRELDIGQQGFFFPSRAQSRLKKKSSS